MREGSGNVDERFIIAEVCERYGWTYYEYMEQPKEFLDLIRSKLKVEAEVARDKQKQ